MKKGIAPLLMRPAPYGTGLFLLNFRSCPIFSNPLLFPAFLLHSAALSTAFDLFSAYSGPFCAYPPFCVSMRFHCIPGPFICIGVLSLAAALRFFFTARRFHLGSFSSIAVPLQSKALRCPFKAFPPIRYSFFTDRCEPNPLLRTPLRRCCLSSQCYSSTASLLFCSVQCLCSHLL